MSLSTASPFNHYLSLWSLKTWRKWWTTLTVAKITLNSQIKALKSLKIQIKLSLWPQLNVITHLSSRTVKCPLLMAMKQQRKYIKCSRSLMLNKKSCHILWHYRATLNQNTNLKHLDQAWNRFIQSLSPKTNLHWSCWNKTSILNYHLTCSRR